MGYVGNKNGPRKSQIAAKLGAAYFGITDDQLAREIEDYEDEEAAGEVDPVLRDSQGRWFLRFLAPGGGVQEYYLEENGYHLEGDVLEQSN